MVYFKGHTIIGEHMKRNIVLFLSFLFCFGCATTNVVNRSSNYTENTKVFKYLKEAGQVNWATAGDYDYYFTKVINVTPNYQLIYHHPGDYTTDTYSYYVALVEFSGKNENLQASATYNGKSLPVAVNYVKVISSYNYVNILLTKEDLIYAYENVGKLIIPLVADGKTYNIVFPDYYLRKVLASTTNIDKYKIAEQLANPPAPAPAPAPVQYNKNEGLSRDIFEYSSNVQPPSYITENPDMHPKVGKEEKITADLKVNNKDNKMYFTVTYIIQPYKWFNKEERTYVKSFVIREKEVYDDYCRRVKTSFDSSILQGLKIQCKRGSNDKYKDIASFDLIKNPRPTPGYCDNCSVVKHI